MRNAPPLPLRDRLRGRAARALGRLPGWLQTRLAGRAPMEADGHRLDPMLRLVLAARPPAGPDRLVAGTPEEARARFRREILALVGTPTPVQSVRNLVVPGAARPLRARHYTPPADGLAKGEQPPLLVFYHGGGFVLGDLDTHDEPCRLLCRRGRQHVLSVAYRLAPEEPFPAAVEDAVAAFRWAQASAAALGAEEARVAVGGDSAGGNLAAVTALLCKGERPPAAQLLIYPSADRTRAYPSHERFDEGLLLSLTELSAFSKSYYGATEAAGADSRISPLLAPDHGGLAPALVVTAGFDVLRDEGEAYAAALQRAGTPCQLVREGALAHGFLNLTGISRGARRATVRLARRWRALLDALPETG